MDRIAERCPPDVDPALSLRTPANLQLVKAGRELHRFWVAKAMLDDAGTDAAWAGFVEAWEAAGEKAAE